MSGSFLGIVMFAVALRNCSMIDTDASGSYDAGACPILTCVVGMSRSTSAGFDFSLPNSFPNLSAIAILLVRTGGLVRLP